MMSLMFALKPAVNGPTGPRAYYCTGSTAASSAAVIPGNDQQRDSHVAQGGRAPRPQQFCALAR